MLKIHTLTLGEYQVNCYIVHEEGCRECLVIDPGYQPDTILGFLEENQLHPQAILLTHGHFDHVGAVADVAAETDCRIFLCPEDLAMPPYMTAGKLVYTDTYGDGDVLELAGMTISVMHTPGHTPGSVCLRIGDVIFSGDTLFQGSCGRTDLPCGNARQITDSLKKLAVIPENCMVFPGHGPRTSLDQERRINPFMR